MPGPSTSAAQARERFATARVARLATVSPAGEPHLVPITFALLDQDTIVTAVDHKPKRTTALKRLANLTANPAVAILADHYSDDWEQLWWVRADGQARVVAPRADIRRALAQRYPQYRERPPEGPAVVVEVTRWSGWSAAETEDRPPGARSAAPPRGPASR